MTKVLIDKNGFVYGWNYEMAKHVDLYTEIDSTEVAAYQQAYAAQAARQPRRTLSGPEREALLATGNTQGHFPTDAEITVVVPPSGLQMQQAMERRSAAPEQLTLAPEPELTSDGPPMGIQQPMPPAPVPTEPAPVPAAAVAGGVSPAPTAVPRSGPQRVVLRKRPE